VNDSDFPKPPNDDKNDWGKTNFRHPAQPPADDWGNTVANVRHEDADFGKTFTPGSNNAPKTPDWGVTQGNIRLPQDDYSGNADRYGGSGGGNDYGATTPYFRLPETERAKYENIPLTPTQEATKKKEEEKQQGGVPSWIWVSGGLLGMFLFSIIVLMLAWYFLIRQSGYEATVKGAPKDSRVLVNGTYWGTTAPDGSVKLPVLKAGEEKTVEIKHPNYVCEPKKVKGQDGVKPEPIIAQCKQVANISNDCINIKAGAYDKAEQCANKALDELQEGYSVDDLLRAMNLYIIQFASGKFDIPDRNMKFLERASGYMKKLPPNVIVEVGGHTDSDGSDDSNKILSDNRAKAVKAALIQFGVKAEMLTEKGYGESKPKTTNDTDDGKFQNRRIEYTAVR
jgi:outer membrane protein OmpA-like peptidoglycan-associated protein